jgi:hypothetical protein
MTTQNTLFYANHCRVCAAEMRSHTANRLWLAKKGFEKVLHAVAPSVWIPEYTLVSFSNTPYHEARKRVAKQDRFVVSLFSSPPPSSI